MTNTVDVCAPIEQEGTKAVVKHWHVKIGEHIAEGEPLVELETDKVAVETPAPATGILREIIVNADEEASPGAVLGRLDPSASTDAPAPEVQLTGAAASDAPTMEAPAALTRANGQAREQRLSPSVRRLVSENNLDPSQIPGTGKAGRVTREDVLAFLEKGAPHEAPQRAPLSFEPVQRAPQQPGEAGGSMRVPHDGMRRRIAEHMSHSLSTAPHVTAVFEADFSAVAAHRARRKADYAARGVNLTYTPYVIAASIAAMEVAPAVNAQWHDDYVEVFSDINVGVGVALGDKGLIVPVIHEAQTLSHFGLASALHERTEKARAGKLAPADVRGGTFSISNHGASGSLVAAPIIINQPQSAILGVGKLEKRVVVREVGGVDTIQIRPMAFVSLSIDHRVLDGAQTNAWLTRFVDVIENWPLD